MDVRHQHSRQYKGSLAWDWERMIRKNTELEDFVDFLEIKLDKKTKEIKLLKSDRRCLRKEVRLLAEERYDLEQIILDQESAKVTLNNLAQRNKSLEEELTKSRKEAMDYQRKFQESFDLLQASEDLSRKLYGEISDSVRAVSIAEKKVAVAEARLYDLERLRQSSSKVENVSCFKQPEGQISVATGGKHLFYPEISNGKLNETVGRWTDKTAQIFSLPENKCHSKCFQCCLPSKKDIKGDVSSLNACNGKLWVALNAFIVIHRILGEGDPTFHEELLDFSHKMHILQLSNFEDDSSPIAWDCSAWVRTYALYIEERLECFRILKYDFEAERLVRPDGSDTAHSRTWILESQDLLEQLPTLQQLLYRLVGSRPEGAASSDYVIQQEAIKALEIFRRAGQQARSLSEFYEVCRGLELARNFQCPNLREPPQSFLGTLEEYIEEAPSIMPVLSEQLEFPESLLLTYKPEEDVSGSLLDLWKNPPYVDSSLHLPCKDDFIPQEFSLNCTVKDGYSSVKNCVLAELFVTLLKDELDDIIYQASVAKLDTYLSIVADRFKVIKEVMERSYRNTNIKPLHHSTYLRLQLLREHFWDVDDKLDCLSSISLADLEAFVPQLLSQLHIEGICHGNFHQKMAINLSDIFTSVFPAEPLPLELRHHDAGISYFTNIGMGMKGLMAHTDPNRRGHTVISITEWLTSWLGNEFSRPTTIFTTDWRKRFPSNPGRH